MFDGEEDVRKKEMGAQRSIVFMVVLKKFKQLLIYSLILRYNGKNINVVHIRK